MREETGILPAESIHVFVPYTHIENALPLPDFYPYRTINNPYRIRLHPDLLIVGTPPGINIK